MLEARKILGLQFGFELGLGARGWYGPDADLEPLIEPALREDQ